MAAGGDITEVTLSLGPTAVGITQISEIADKPQSRLAGLPLEELQNYTVFVAGVPADAPQSGGVTALLKFLRSPTAIAVIRAKGMEDFGSLREKANVDTIQNTTKFFRQVRQTRGPRSGEERLPEITTYAEKQSPLSFGTRLAGGPACIAKEMAKSSTDPAGA